MDINNEKAKIQLEAFTALKKVNFNGIVLLPTGSGKGKIMLDCLLHLNQPKILYLCNTTLARDHTFKDELRAWDKAHLIDKIQFECYQTACKWVDKSFNIVLGDEFDAALTPQYIKAITKNNFNHKILVSATLEEVKKRQAQKIAPIVYERKVAEMIDRKVLNKQKFYFVNYDLSLAENRRYLEFNRSFVYYLNQPTGKLREFRLNQVKIARKQFLDGLSSSVAVSKWLIQKLDKPNNNIIVFTGLSSQADQICPPYSFHSNDKTGIEWFNKFDLGTINKLAVVGKIDRALNIKGINNIVFSSVGSSKTRLTQRTGRGMRLGVEDTLNIFFQVPYFRDTKGVKKPTVVLSWILKSTVDNDISKATNIDYV